jgi:hypothetical protein
VGYATATFEFWYVKSSIFRAAIVMPNYWNHEVQFDLHVELCAAIKKIADTTGGAICRNFRPGRQFLPALVIRCFSVCTANAFSRKRYRSAQINSPRIRWWWEATWRLEQLLSSSFFLGEYSIAGG